MKQSSFATLFLTAVWFTTTVVGQVEGPFGLYTKSEDPAWDQRFLNVGGGNGFWSIGDRIFGHSVPSQLINFFLTTRGSLDPDAPYGELSWGAQAPYSTLYAGISIVNVTSPVQPIFFDYAAPLQGYSSRWNITSDKELRLDNYSQFYAKQLVTQFYNSSTVHWGFGGLQDSDAVAITIRRYDRA